MLLTKFIKVKINKGNLGFYRNLLKIDININDIIKVPIEKISKTSKYKVDAKCDICGVINSVSYLSYNKSLTYDFYSCHKCKNLKKEITNTTKYGVKNFNNSNKRKETMIDKYGYYYNNREKSKETCIDKYGVENVSSVFDIKNKRILNILDKYGVENVFQLEDIKNKSKETLSNKYGIEHNKKTVFFRKDFLICKDENYVKYINNSISLFKCDKGHEFEISTNLYYNRKYNNVPLCTICNPIGDQKSIKEKELFEFIKSVYSGDIIQSYRDGLEIDIYLPNLKLGFEFNGLFWHSELYRDKNYHLDKTNYFKEKGIRIIHIWEDDWDFKKDIIKSQILNILGKTNNKIYARKCDVREIKNSKDFLNENHIQGQDRSSIKIGLFYNDKLVSVMTFDKFEGRKKMENNGYNLSRFCNVLNSNIIGGASKLLNYFIKNYNPLRIVSYTDKDWSIGNLYQVLGFKKISESKPDYKYIVDNKRVHKSRYKKDNLKLEDKSLFTESKIMKEMNINRIYDCGKIKYEFNI